MNTGLTLLEAALEYAASGLKVFPLHTAHKDGSCSCGDEACRQQGKHPRTREGHREATCDLAQIKRWWGPRGWPNANIGGLSDSYLCLDVDVKHAGLGVQSLEKLIADNAPLPETCVVQTGQNAEGVRGTHYWFLVPEGTEVASRVGVRPGVDVKTRNGYAIMPPSTHKSGVAYDFLVPFEEADYAPDWLLTLCNKPSKPGTRWEARKGHVMADEVRDFFAGRDFPALGEQRMFLVRAARSFLDTGATAEEAAEMLWHGYDGDGGISNAPQDDEQPWTIDDCYFIAEDVMVNDPPTRLRNEEVKINVKDGGKKKDKEPQEEYFLTDWGNARRLVDSYGKGEVIHVPEWKKWYVWDGTRWVEDDGVALALRVEAMTKVMREEAVELMNRDLKDEGKMLLRHANGTQSRPRTEAALALATNLVRTRPDELNTDEFLLQVQNGVVDLRTAELLPPDPSRLMTKRTRCEYVRGARDPLWDKVLEDWVPRQEMRDFLQRVFGYALTASTDEHKFFYFYGMPGTGKSTLLEAFTHLMGNYAETSEPDTFLTSRQAGGPTEDVARLSAARVVVTHEVEEGARFAEAKISHYTGGDTVTARFLHAPSFDFKPKFKLFFTANHLPKVSGSSRSGLWRRLIVVEFDRVIPEDEKDPLLATKLRRPEVLSAMLAWAVEGARLWMADREQGRLMIVPSEVREAVDQYRREADYLDEFLKTLVIVDDRSVRTPKPDMNAWHKTWCHANGIDRPKGPKALTARLREMGLTDGQARFDQGPRDCWFGVQVSGEKEQVRMNMRNA